ncbi:MAG: nitroreductase family protein [Actinobacteria bacterium]|nr:nitroreductase family protein [Actinomycetota bacterium]MBU1492500.1 nitroreductase family protein [Actinomycetota bacterium]MBU1866305.1 nitroreductase family protein [Actinomycetota bacterium]
MEPRPSTYADVVGLRVCRNYLPDPIPRTEVEAILEAARWTGSSKNTQKWAFVVVDDPAGRQALAGAGSFTRPIRAAALAIAIVWPSDGYEFDIGRVAQNMMLAAAALGIGSCPVTLHDEDIARRVLGVPQGHQCRYAIALGYPDQEAEAAERRERRDSGKAGRKAIEEMTSWGKFGSPH